MMRGLHNKRWQPSESVWRALQPLGLRRPRDGGIYATAATVTELCARDTLGKIDEQPAVYGKRWQLLWDAQPVYQTGPFEDLVQRVIARYSTADFKSPENSRQAMLRSSLHENSQVLKAELVRFLFAHCEDWDAGFWGSLMF